MTTYGTIPTSSSPAGATVNLEYISRAKEHIKAGLGTCRSWREMFDFHRFSIPKSAPDATARLKSNGAYFLTNYRLVVLVILFLVLIWHPISIVVLAALMAAWQFPYALRGEPLVLGRTISESVVLAALWVATIAVLMLTHTAANIIGALVTGSAVVLIHCAMRETDDLSLNEEAAGGSLRSSAGSSSSSRV